MDKQLLFILTWVMQRTALVLLLELQYGVSWHWHDILKVDVQSPCVGAGQVKDDTEDIYSTGTPSVFGS